MFIAFALSLSASLSDGRAAVEKLVATLKAVDKATYSYKRTLNYPGSSYHHELNATVYVDFDEKAGPVGVLFQIQRSGLRQVFNGKSYFLQEEGKPSEGVIAPKEKVFDPISELKNSPIGLGKSLTQLLGKKGIKFTLNPQGAIEFSLDGIELGPSGTVEVGYGPRYLIEVDSDTFLPKRIVQHLAKDEDTIETVFTNWNTNPTEPSKESWFDKGGSPTGK